MNECDVILKSIDCGMFCIRLRVFLSRHVDAGLADLHQREGCGRRKNSYLAVRGDRRLSLFEF